MRPLIIGAGPVGSNIAKQIKSLDPLVIDERSNVGVPVHCTGLVSTRLQQITGYPDSLIQNTFKGAKLFSKNKEVIIEAKRVMAHAIDRRGFDKFMLNQSGAEVTHEKFLNYSNGVAVTNKSKYMTDLVIDCSGAKYGLLGLQAVAPLKREEGFVELHFDVVKDFFAWVVPLSNGLARIGLASKNNSMSVLKSFLNKVGAGTVSEWNAGLLPLKINDFVEDNYVRCGDAAGQVKAVSGGGLVTGVLSGNLLSKAVLKAFEVNDFSKEFFTQKYLTPFNQDVGKELLIHSFARKYLDSCNYDELLNFINKNKKAFEEYGDMDFLSSLVFKLLKKPGNYGFFLKNIPKLFSALV